jgi:hypothetical protein
MGFIQMKLPKRIQVRLADTKRKRVAQAKHQEWLEANGLDDNTLRRSARDFKGYDIPNYTPDPNQPKCGDKIPVGTGNKKQHMQYSGERRLLGIGMMHKSNLVPIWDKEGAEEISTMRRN